MKLDIEFFFLFLSFYFGGNTTRWHILNCKANNKIFVSGVGQGAILHLIKSAFLIQAYQGITRHLHYVNYRVPACLKISWLKRHFYTFPMHSAERSPQIDLSEFRTQGYDMHMYPVIHKKANNGAWSRVPTRMEDNHSSFYSKQRYFVLSLAIFD